MRHLVREQCRPFWLLVILGCGLLDLRCDEQSVAPGNQAVYLIPMKVGNQWHYESDFLDSLGNVLFTTNKSVRIYSDTLVGGSLWFGFSGQGYRINKSDGVWQLHPSPFLEFPNDLGDSVLQGNGVTYTRLVTKGARVTVPAGTFVCFQYAETNPQFSNALVRRCYLAPSMGLVKEEAFDVTSRTLSAVTELVVYEMN